MHMPAYRSLKRPQPPDPSAADYHGQYARYWRESEIWWDNWAHNFVLSLVLWPALFVGLCLILVLVAR